ncbi:hypothetical protein [Gordonia lacunae]|uniref:hypothetical protein n=1 Tax=Gordonia lacunae TaxID=417102 RepID=UPI0011822D04|nr:hypothetical protein [Gordonia lacunae]
MSTLEPVLSERAEAACRLISQTLALHQANNVNDDQEEPQRRLPGRSNDLEQIQLQTTLLRLVSIAEWFCGDTLIKHAEESMSDSRESRTFESIWREASASATMTWELQAKYYKEWLEITLNWTAIKHYVDARNAIAHGLGELTRKQLGKNPSSIKTRLNNGGVAVSGNSVRLTKTNLHDAATACKELIRNVDILTQDHQSSR